MKNKLESENKMNDQIIQKKKREYQKRQSINDRSFVFTKELLNRLDYQGNGIAPDKRFDKKSKESKESLAELDQYQEDRKKARDKNYRKLAAEEK